MTEKTKRRLAAHVLRLGGRVGQLIRDTGCSLTEAEIASDVVARMYSETDISYDDLEAAYNEASKP